MRRAGVYAIVHRLSGRRYIGASRNIARRWTRHCNRLRASAHANWLLQQAWDRDGADAFEVVVLEAVDDLAQLQERERVHLAVATAEGDVFNLMAVGASSERLSAGNVGRHAWTDAQRQAQRERARGFSPDAAWRAKHRAALKGQRKRPEHAAKLRANLDRIRPDNRGTTRSPETKARMAEAARLAWARRKAQTEAA